MTSTFVKKNGVNIKSMPIKTARPSSISKPSAELSTNPPRLKEATTGRSKSRSVDPKVISTRKSEIATRTKASLQNIDGKQTESSSAEAKLGLPIKAPSSPEKQRPENRPVQITIKVPSPPEPFEEEGPYLSSLGKEELISTLTPPCGSFEPLVGDVKLTLDDLKSSILRYYSHLYQAEGQTIDEKLHYLQRNYYPSPYPIEGARPSSVALPVDREPSNVTNTIDEGLCERDPLPSNQQVDSTGWPSHCHTVESTPQVLFGPNFLGALYPVKAPFPEELAKERLQHDGLIQPASGTSPYSLKPQMDESPSLRLSPRHGIAEVISEIKRDADSVTRRLVGMTDLISRETDDPSLRAFSYVNYPRIKRRPYFGTQREMEHHMSQLYSDLYSQIDWNQRRINALRRRLAILQMNTVGSMQEGKRDPRLAY